MRHHPLRQLWVEQRRGWRNAQHLVGRNDLQESRKQSRITILIEGRRAADAPAPGMKRPFSRGTHQVRPGRGRRGMAMKFNLNAFEQCGAALKLRLGTQNNDG